MNNRTIDARLLNAQVAIDNAMGNDSIKTPLAAFGYDEAKLLSGKALLDDAIAKHDSQKKEYGDQFAASDQLDAAKSAANSTYMTHLKVARVALKGNRGPHRHYNSTDEDSRHIRAGSSRPVSSTPTRWPMQPSSLR